MVRNLTDRDNCTRHVVNMLTWVIDIMQRQFPCPFFVRAPKASRWVWLHFSNLLFSCYESDMPGTAVKSCQFMTYLSIRLNIPMKTVQVDTGRWPCFFPGPGGTRCKTQGQPDSRAIHIVYGHLMSFTYYNLLVHLGQASQMQERRHYLGIMTLV